MRDLARRLLAAEAASQTAAGPHVHEAVRVCEKLRISLTRFAGADGFAVAPAAGAGSGPRGRPCAAKRHGQGRRLAWKDLKSSPLMRALERREATRRSRSPPICSGCWSPSSANPSRCAWCARLGPTHRWTNSIQESRLLHEHARTRSRQGSSDHSATAHRRAGPR